MATKALIPDHYWALVTMDQEGGLDMSFWESHEDAKEALFHWWAYGDDELEAEISKLSDNEQQEKLMRYCFDENVYWWIVPARYFNIALMGSQPWAVKLTEFWGPQSNYSTKLQPLPNIIEE